MKSIFRHTFLLILSFLITFASPIDNTTNEVEDNQQNLGKRYDVNTYISSMGHYLLSKDIKHTKYGPSKNGIDIYYSRFDKHKKNPVVIYIFGGSWYLGEKSMYSKLGDNLRNFGFVTAIPNYVQFPFGTLDAMTYDISEAIKWVYNNIEKYGGDRNNIIVLGHSSGAHLIALTLLKNTLGLGSNTGSNYFINGLPPLKRVVLLNGPFDFDLLSEEARKTGVKIKNSKTRKLLETALCSKDASPTDVLKRYSDKSIYNFNVGLIVLMHAEEDATVPVVSSYDLLREIQRTSNNPATVYLTHGYYHCGITEGVMNGDIIAIEYLVRGLMADDFNVPCFNIDPLDEIEARRQAEERAKEQPKKEEEEWEKKQSGKEAKKEEEEWARRQAEEQAKKEAQQRFEDQYEWNGEMWVMKDKSKKNDYWDTGNIYNNNNNNNNNNNHNNNNNNYNPYMNGNTNNGNNGNRNNNDYWFENDVNTNKNDYPFMNDDKDKKSWWPFW